MNLIFDFDGTIADSLDDVVEVVNQILDKIRMRPLTTKELRTKGALAALKSRKIPKITLPLIIFYARWKIKKRIPDMSLAAPISGSLINLSQKNLLGIVTTNSQKNVEKFLEKNFNNNPFKFIQSEILYFQKAKKLRKVVRKYELEPAETVYIGDEIRDIKAAKKAGIKSIAVSWGFESPELLKKENPDYLVKNTDSLLSIVNNL